MSEKKKYQKKLFSYYRGEVQPEKLKKVTPSKEVKPKPIPAPKLPREGISFYIANLSFQRDEDGLKELFRPFGKVIKMRLIRDGKENKSKGVAFVLMGMGVDSERLVKTLNGKLVDGRKIKVSVALEQPYLNSKKSGDTGNDVKLKMKPKKLHQKNSPFKLKVKLPTKLDITTPVTRKKSSSSEKF